MSSSSPCSSLFSPLESLKNKILVSSLTFSILMTTTLVYFSLYHYYFLSTALTTIILSTYSLQAIFSNVQKPPRNINYTNSPPLLTDSCAEEEVSLSDDDNFIEMTFPDGHSLEPAQINGSAHCRIMASLELLFRKNGLLDLLREINDDEDNWIEINFSIASCSTGVR